MLQEDYSDSAPKQNLDEYDNYENDSQYSSSPQDRNIDINNKKVKVINISADIDIEDEQSNSNRTASNSSNQNNDENEPALVVKERSPSSTHSRHSSRKHQNNYYDDSYSVDANNIRFSQPSSVHLHFSASSNSLSDTNNPKSGEISGYCIHLEPSTVTQTAESDLSSEKAYKATETRSKKISKQQPQKKPKKQQSQPQSQSQQPIQRQIPKQREQQDPQQFQQKKPKQQSKQQPRQQEFIDDSPDSYQISDKLVDRDINLDGKSNNSQPSEYTYEYISESNSFYQRVAPNIQTNGQPQQYQRQQPQQYQRQQPQQYQRQQPQQYQRQQPQQYQRQQLQQYQRQQPQQPQTRAYQDLDDDSSYTYTYDFPSSSLDLNDNNDKRYTNQKRAYNPNSNNNSPRYNNNNQFRDRNAPIDLIDDDSQYTYTYDSVTNYNDTYDYSPESTQYNNNPNRRSNQPQPRTIRAELIPKQDSGKPIKMQLQIPTPTADDIESTNDYTYTYDEPTTEEKRFIESMKNRSISDISSPKEEKPNFAVSNVLQVEIPPVETKKKHPNKSRNNKNKKNKLSPRKAKIQDKINKLKSNLNKLNAADREEYEYTDDDDQSVDPNDNQKVNNLKNKLANLTGWAISPRDGQNMIGDTKSYTYTYEYESEVYANNKPDLRLVSPVGAISIEAANQFPPAIERNASLSPQIEDLEPIKPSLSISPAVQSESSRMNNDASRKKKSEQLQEIVELEKRLKLLKMQVSEDSKNNENSNDDGDDDEEAFSYENTGDESPHEKNRVRVKKKVRVAKQVVKLSKDLEEAKKQPRMKKIHRRVRVEKNTSHHHTHSHSGSARKGSNDANVGSDDVINREVNLSDVNSNNEVNSYTHSETLQLLDESSSSSQPSSGAIPSPKSPIKLLDEGDETDDEEQEGAHRAVRVHVDAVENVPDVDAFVVLFLERTGDARKTRVAPKGARKEFNQTVELPLPNDDSEEGVESVALLVKRQDLIKGDRLLGSAKLDVDVDALRGGSKDERWVKLNSDVGIQTEGRIHIIVSLHDIASPNNSEMLSDQKVSHSKSASEKMSSQNNSEILSDQKVSHTKSSSEKVNSQNNSEILSDQKVTHTSSTEKLQLINNDNNNNSDNDRKSSSKNNSEHASEKVPSRNNSEHASEKVPSRNNSDNDRKATLRTVDLETNSGVLVEEEEEDVDGQDSLKPSNFTVPREMQDRLKLHRNYTPLHTGDESGVFILDLPSQAASLTNDEDGVPSSSFITDLVNGRNSGSATDSSKKPPSVNFTKSDKIVYNLENDVKNDPRSIRTRSVVIDDSYDEEEDEEEQRRRKQQQQKQPQRKRRAIEKIVETREVVRKETQAEKEEKEPICIDLKFYSDSGYVSGEYTNDYDDGYGGDDDDEEA